MADVVKLNDDDLDSVSGGSLKWKGGYVYCIEDPTQSYRFNDFEACTNYIRTNWGGAAQTNETLQMLEAAGLIWRE